MAVIGTKAVLHSGGRLVVLRRDADPRIPFPGRVDLPGGGADPGEDALACTVREVAEETGLRIPAQRFRWGRAYPAGDRDGENWLFAADISAGEAAAARLGPEGQALWLEELDVYLGRGDAIPHQQARVQDWLADR